MTADPELDLWREQWRSEGGVPPDLRMKVERQSRRMRWVLWSEIVITVVFGGHPVNWALQSQDPVVIVLAGMVLIFCAVAWTLGLSIRRGNWSPATQDTAGFLDISVRRCRASIRTLNVAAALYACEIIFLLAWIYWYRSRREELVLSAFLVSMPMLLVWLATLIFYAGIFWFRRRKQAELETLIQFQTG